jgi:hypothetical protein
VSASLREVARSKLGAAVSRAPGSAGGAGKERLRMSTGPDWDPRWPVFLALALAAWLATFAGLLAEWRRRARRTAPV